MLRCGKFKCQHFTHKASHLVVKICSVSRLFNTRKTHSPTVMVIKILCKQKDLLEHKNKISLL